MRFGLLRVGFHFIFEVAGRQINLQTGRIQSGITGVFQRLFRNGDSLGRAFQQVFLKYPPVWQHLFGLDVDRSIRVVASEPA